MNKLTKNKSFAFILTSTMLMTGMVYADSTSLEKENSKSSQIMVIDAKTGLVLDNEYTVLNKKFSVLKEIRAKYPELTDLIIRSQSLDDEQKQWWLDALPTMERKNIDNLFMTLINEQIELQKLNKQFTEDVKKINEKSKNK